LGLNFNAAAASLILNSEVLILNPYKITALCYWEASANPMLPWTLRRVFCRHAALVIIAVLAVVGAALLLSVCLNPVNVGSSWDKIGSLTVTDVQFSAGNLIITAINNGKVPVTVIEVLVNNMNQTSTPITVPVNELISVNEQGSVSISYDWISGSTYYVRLVSSKGTIFPIYADAPQA